MRELVTCDCLGAAACDFGLVMDRCDAIGWREKRPISLFGRYKITTCQDFRFECLSNQITIRR